MFCMRGKGTARRAAEIDGGRRRRHATALGILLASTAGAGGSAWAQSAAPGAETMLETIVIDAGLDASLGIITARLRGLAGGAAVVSSEDYEGSVAPTLSDALAGVPGVVVQDFFGGNDQPRIQIRGSGLQQNPVERGILVLRDGVPINRADGSYIAGFINPATANVMEVYRGHLANRLGATVLGGAINLMSPPAVTSPATEVTVGVGSFGQRNASARTGFDGDRFDAAFHVDVSRRDGFRDYNDSERIEVGGVVEAEISDIVTSRLFFSYTDLGFDVAGPINKAALEADPSQVSSGPRVTPGGVVNPGPNVNRDQPRRDASQALIGSRTTIDLGDHQVDIGLGYTYTDDTFRFPISSGIRETVGGDVTGLLRYAYSPDAEALLPLFEATAQYTVGSADRRYYLNQSGERGALFGENDLDASTLSLYAGLNIPVAEAWTISPAISYARATRDSSDTYSGATRPTIAYNPALPSVRLPNGAVPATATDYDRSYSAWSPSLSFTYELAPDNLLFAAVSRSFEPPTHDDLLATVNGTPNSSPGRPNPANPALPAAAFSTPDLDAQTATTAEIGWRASHGPVSWDATTYYSWVENELLSLRDATGASLGAINADETIHFGVELGLTAELGDRLVGRLAYTYQDFRFNDDPVRGNNRLAGAPRHIINAILAYQLTEDWSLSASLKWVPERTPVDNMNTLWADPYEVVDLRTEYRINENLSVYGEITNLFDETYASSTLIVDQATADQAAFLPGDGRGFYLGVKSRF
jgi:Outer membrane receptor proteins, mostly Fe transport